MQYSVMFFRASNFKHNMYEENCIISSFTKVQSPLHMNAKYG
jgi:hypothetical protein